MAYEFFVVMQKRSDAKVYADLHKTDERMYLVEEKADEALAGMGDLANHYNKVKIIGVLADEWNSAELARADLEATVKEQSQQLSDITAHAESIEKLSRVRGRQLEEQAAEIERLSERRCEICGYAEHHREHTAERQRVAESCAKVCDLNLNATVERYELAKTQNECASAIRAGQWREHLK